MSREGSAGDRRRAPPPPPPPFPIGWHGLGGIRPPPHPHAPRGHLRAAHVRDPLRLRAARRLAHGAPHPLGLRPRSVGLGHRPRRVLGIGVDRQPRRRLPHPHTPQPRRIRRAAHAAIRVLTPRGSARTVPAHAPDLPLASGANLDGYRVESIEKRLPGPIGGTVVIQYARPLSGVDDTIARVELLLVLGALAGSGLALLAGAALARRAMEPIATLTSTAAEIARTRDAAATVPLPLADDEVAELARTLQGMLRSLDDAHLETEAMLVRQRRFVADASHELRTPLTSVLANLELLAESLRGDEAEAARSALRSSRRMRRLVADLLLLARSDVGRVAPRAPCDLAQLALEAAAELGPLSADARGLCRRPPGGRTGRPRRPPPARAQPRGERAAPHAAGDGDRSVHAAVPARRRRRRAGRGGAHGRGRRTRVPPTSPPRSSSASSAAPATAAAPSASAWRSYAPSPPRTEVRSPWRPSSPTARASSCACRPRPSGDSAPGADARRARGALRRRRP